MRARWLLALVLVCLGGSLAHAESRKPTEAERESRRLFERAEAHFKSGLYAEALAEYQAGYEASPLPGFLINIAQCQRRLGDLDQARVTYRKFVVVAPDSRFVPEVNSLIAELDRLLEERQAAEPAPPPAPPPSAPPAFEPVKAPEPQVAPAALVTTPPPAPPETGGTRWWLWGTLGAVVLAAGATFFVLRSPGTTTVHDGSIGTLRR